MIPPSVPGETLLALRAYFERRSLALTPETLFQPGVPHRVGAICYLEYTGPRGLAVLMLRRRKEPFAGYWTAPGGKLEPGEDPEACACREMREEIGVTVRSPRLVLVTSERSSAGEAAYNWVLFAFRERWLAPPGAAPRALEGESPEGELRWFPLDRLPELPIPDVDRRLLPYLFPDTGLFGDGPPAPGGGAAGPEAAGRSHGRPSSPASPRLSLCPPDPRASPFFARIVYDKGHVVQELRVRPAGRLTPRTS